MQIGSLNLCINLTRKYDMKNALQDKENTDIVSQYSTL